MWWRAGDTGSSRDWRLVIRLWEKGCRSPAGLSSMVREDVEFIFLKYILIFKVFSGLV